MEEAELAELESADQVEKLQAALERLEQDMREQEAEAQNIQRQFTEFSQKENRHKQTIEQQEKLITELNDRLADVQRSADYAEQQQSQKAEQYDRLKEELRAAESRIYRFE